MDNSYRIYKLNLMGEKIYICQMKNGNVYWTNNQNPSYQYHFTKEEALQIVREEGSKLKIEKI